MKKSSRLALHFCGLQDDANQPAAALVDDLREGFLELLLGVLGHAVQFALNPFAYQVLQRLPRKSEFQTRAGSFSNSSVKYRRALLLFLRTHERRHFRHDVGPHHVDRRALARRRTPTDRPFG